MKDNTKDKMEANRARVFRLPGIHELNKGQETARALPLEGQHLIIGGPGTGKSVVALLRARRLAREGKPYLFLVYNHLLRQSNLHLFADDPRQLEVKTWDAWFRGQYRDRTGMEAPTKEPQAGKAFRPIDWTGVEQALMTLPRERRRIENPPYLVIDEGQDMPPAFYQTLIALGFENFYVTADQNQQIHPEHCSSRQDIETVLVIAPQKTLILAENYRNTLPIARLAHAFYTGDPASPPPELPPARPNAKAPLLLRHTPETFGKMIDWILVNSDKNPRKLIGIITPDNVTRERFCDALKQAQPRLDHGKPPIQTYATGQTEPLDFAQGGLMVINAQSCKGLEFDTVILAGIEQHWGAAEHLKMRFYVMVSRAREFVILLRNGDADPDVENLLPSDQAILARRN
jgi:superfamily I DNA/RNA helicase